jgi:hypothetical protein
VRKRVQEEDQTSYNMRFIIMKCIHSIFTHSGQILTKEQNVQDEGRVGQDMHIATNDYSTSDLDKYEIIAIGLTMMLTR